MKAQRRHELKANSLIWTLQGLPETIKKYQSQISLALIIIALTIVMVRYRMSVAAERLAEAQRSLSTAGDDLHQMKSYRFYPGADGAQFMRILQELYFDGLQRADDALQKAPDSQPGMKAEALLDKGDINFQMANSPELPGAATQAALRPGDTVENLLNNAFEAYTQVLQQYPSEKFAVTSAHFGLAAIAENRAATNNDASQWDAAKTQYQAVIDSDAEPAYKTLATIRMGLLPKLSQAVASGLFAPAATQPTTTVSRQQGPSLPTTRK
jgi:hypothetical protein